MNFSYSESPVTRKIRWVTNARKYFSLRNVCRFFSNVRFLCSLNWLFFRLPRKGDRLSPDIVKRRDWGENVGEKQNLCATESWKRETERKTENGNWEEKVDSEIRLDYIKADLFRLSEMKIFKIIKRNIYLIII